VLPDAWPTAVEPQPTARTFSAPCTMPLLVKEWPPTAGLTEKLPVTGSAIASMGLKPMRTTYQSPSPWENGVAERLVRPPPVARW
jgi:hypothetical protein